MITPYLPRRCQSGGQTSSYYSIKYLAKENDITLISFSRDKEGLEEISQYCHQVIVVKRGLTWDLKKILFTGFSVYPFLVVNYLSKDLQQTIAQELQKNHYDLIHCECFYLMPNIPPTKIPIVMVDQTIEYAVYQHYVQTLHGWKKLITPLLWIDVWKLKYWEIFYWKHTHTVTAFSTEDQEIISQITGRKDIRLFQNGVDKRFYDSVAKTAKSKNPSILFGVSNMKWMQNREAVEILYYDLWPKIKQAIPQCELYIIGRNAPEKYGHLRSTDVFVNEAESDGQPHDPQYYYNYCWVLVAPIGSGGGSRNKFFEAMACRLPIITTPEGMGGIKITNFVESIVCPYQDLVKYTIELLKNKKRREAIGRAANRLIKKNYSYEKSAQGLNQIYGSLNHHS